MSSMLLVLLVAYLPITMTFGALIVRGILVGLNRLAWPDDPEELPSEDRFVHAWLFLLPQPILIGMTTGVLQMMDVASALPLSPTIVEASLPFVATGLTILTFGLGLALILHIPLARGIATMAVYVLLVTLLSVGAIQLLQTVASHVGS